MRHSGSTGNPAGSSTASYAPFYFIGSITLSHQVLSSELSCTALFRPAIFCSVLSYPALLFAVLNFLLLNPYGDWK